MDDVICDKHASPALCRQTISKSVSPPSVTEKRLFFNEPTFLSLNHFSPNLQEIILNKAVKVNRTMILCKIMPFKNRRNIGKALETVIGGGDKVT